MKTYDSLNEDEKAFSVLYFKLGEKLHWFAWTEAEKQVLDEIMTRTLYIGKKLEYRFSPRKLSLSRGMCVRSYNMAKCSLAKRGVICVFPSSVSSFSPLIRFNALGMARKLKEITLSLSHRILATGLESDTFDASRQDDLLSELVFQLERFWKENGWEEVPVTLTEKMQMKLDKAEEKGKQQSGLAKQKKMERITSAPKDDIRVGWVFELLREYCEAAGLHYYEKVDSQTELKKLWGSARNFLAYCKRDGLDPRKILQAYVDNWFELSYCLKRPDGSSISFLGTVTFMDFFANRGLIMQRLKEKEIEALPYRGDSSIGFKFTPAPRETKSAPYAEAPSGSNFNSKAEEGMKQRGKKKDSITEPPDVPNAEEEDEEDEEENGEEEEPTVVRGGPGSYKRPMTWAEINAKHRLADLLDEIAKEDEVNGAFWKRGPQPVREETEEEKRAFADLLEPPEWPPPSPEELKRRCDAYLKERVLEQQRKASAKYEKEKRQREKEEREDEADRAWRFKGLDV